MEKLEIKRILCPVDFSDFTTPVINYAVGLAEQFGSSIYVIHIIPHVTPLSRTSYFDGDENKAIEKLCEENIPKGITHEFELVKNDDVSDGVCAFAKEKSIDFIIMGSHGHSKIESILLGNDVDDVSRHAPCPLLIVRRQEA